MHNLCCIAMAARVPNLGNIPVPGFSFDIVGPLSGDASPLLLYICTIASIRIDLKHSVIILRK